MYVPPAFAEADPVRIRSTIADARIANLITSTVEGLQATPLPLLLDVNEGEHGVLHGHMAKANPQWRCEPVGEALAIFMGVNAYITPSWYETKRETGKVVPTWNYVTVHAYGRVEFFEDPERLLAVVGRLTDHHEGTREMPWKVADAPADFIAAQLRGIVGVRMVISRLEAKVKMSQNRPERDRQGVAAGLAESERPSDRQVAALVRDAGAGR